MKTSAAKDLSYLAYLYLLLLPFGASLVYANSVLDHTFLPRFSLAYGAVLLLSLALWRYQNQLEFPKINWVLGAFLAYLLWQGQSCFWASTFAEALLETQRILLSFAVFWFSLIFFRNVPDFGQRLLQVALALSLIAILVALWQLLQIEQIDKLSLYSVKGIAGHRNLFGTFLLLMLGFSAMAYQRWTGIGQKMALANGLLVLLFLFLLQARSAWVALVGATLFGLLVLAYFKGTGVVKKSLRWSIIPLGILGLAFAWYAWQGGLKQFQNRLNISRFAQSETAVERTRLWQKTWCTFQNHPLTGVGAGNWQTHYADCNLYGLYSVELNNLTYQRPHHDLLWVLSEAGILGFLTYLMFWLGILFLGLKALGTSSASVFGERLIRLVVLVGLLIVANFSFPKERIELLLWTYTLLAWIYFDWTQTQSKAPFSKKAPTAILLLLLAGAMGTLYTASQRWKGEYHMNRVYAAKIQQKWPQLIEEANLAYSRFYTIDPNAVPIHWYRGSGHFSEGQISQARLDYLKALEVAPFSQHSWNDLGSCWEKEGQRDKARKCYLESIRISPLFDDPLLNLAILSYKDQDYPKALYWIDKMSNQERAKPYRGVIEEAMNQPPEG